MYIVQSCILSGFVARPPVNLLPLLVAGEHPKEQTYVLQGSEMPQAHATQGDAVQEGQGLAVRSRSGWLSRDTCHRRLEYLYLYRGFN